MSDEQNISVRDSLAAAMTDLSGAEAPATAPEAAAAPEAAPQAEATPTAPEGRDEKGRFAPKEPKVEASADAPLAAQIETATPAAPEPQETETTRIPPSLPAAVKAQWAELKPEVQQAFTKLEDSVQTAKAEWGKKGERLNRYDEIMAPRTEKLTLQGIDEFTFIKTLVAAQDFLERDPVGGIQYLARSYGVNLTQLAPQPNAPRPGAEGQPAPTADPNFEAMLKPLVTQVQTLQQQIAQSTQSTEAAKLATAQSEVEQFRADPANMYFDNVKDDVAYLLESGRAKTLAQAYEKAIWASDEIRPLLQKAQSAELVKKDAEAAAQRKAASARQSAGSVTGAPSPGATAPSGPPGSVRDSLRASMQELGAI